MIKHKYLLTFYRNCASRVASAKSSDISSKFCAKFNEYYPKVIDKALGQLKYIDHPHLTDRIKKLSEYYVLSKFPLQGEFLIHAYELLEKPENITKEKLNQAYCLACASEAFLSYFLVQDDVYDMSEIRARKPCWHLLPDASALAVNDTLILRSFINEILRQNIDESMYTQVIDVFNEMYFACEMGQLLDLMISRTKDHSKLTMENYERICYHKASYFSMNSPILFALILANKANEETFKLVYSLCNDLGVLIQIHNDFTEYLASEYLNIKKPNTTTVVNKSGTDIETGKCAWPAVVALQHFNVEQRNIFNECFGSSDQGKVERVVQLYDEINLPQLYKQEENARYDTFMQKVRNLPANTTPSPEFFRKILKYFQTYTSDTSRYYYL